MIHRKNIVHVWDAFHINSASIRSRSTGSCDLEKERLTGNWNEARMNDKPSGVIECAQNDGEEGSNCVYCCTFDKYTHNSDKARSVERHDSNNPSLPMLEPDL